VSAAGTRHEAKAKTRSSSPADEKPNKKLFRFRENSTENRVQIRCKTRFFLLITTDLQRLQSFLPHLIIRNKYLIHGILSLILRNMKKKLEKWQGATSSRVLFIGQSKKLKD
jgi:hypothetical protein